MPCIRVEKVFGYLIFFHTTTVTSTITYTHAKNAYDTPTFLIGQNTLWGIVNTLGNENASCQPHSLQYCLLLQTGSLCLDVLFSTHGRQSFARSLRLSVFLQVWEPLPGFLLTLPALLVAAPHPPSSMLTKVRRVPSCGSSRTQRTEREEGQSQLSAMRMVPFPLSLYHMITLRAPGAGPWCRISTPWVACYSSSHPGRVASEYLDVRSRCQQCFILLILISNDCLFYLIGNNG